MDLLIWTLTGEELDRLRVALDGARRLRVAVDQGTFKYAVDGDSWTPGFDPDSR